MKLDKANRGNPENTMANTDNDRATVDQMTQARALCGNSPFLQAELEEFLNSRPSHAQMTGFIESLSDPDRQRERFDRNILRVCKLVGIEEPTRSDKLLALQICVQQEQNAALSLIANRLGAGKQSQSDQSPSLFTPFLTGMLLGTLMSH